MKRAGGFRAVAVVALTLALGAGWANEATHSLLVGQHGLTVQQAIDKVNGVGKVTGQNAEGYFRIVPLANISLEQLANVLDLRFEIVLPGSSDGFRRTNLYSVQSHMDYKRGAHRIRTGREPFLTDLPRLGLDYLETLQWHLTPRVDENTGELDQEAYIRAIRHREAMPPATADMLDPFRARTAAPTAWALVGPRKLATPSQQFFGTTSLSGRKNMVKPAPSNPQIGYVATASGGVWKTTDNWASFTPLSDNWPSLATMCVEVDPGDPNIVYVGTGDAYGTGSAPSFGIMKSTDGGATWTNVGAAEFGDSVVTRIRIDSASTNRIIALVSGPSGDIWRSVDSGATWSRTNAPDVDWQDIDKTGSNWTAVTADGAHVYWARNSGNSWTELPKVTGATGSRWDIAGSKVDSTIAYLLTSAGQVFATYDNFATWTNITAAHDAGCSDPVLNKANGAANMFIETGRTVLGNVDVVYTGLNTISASVDSGFTWYDLSRSFETDARWHSGQQNAIMSPTDWNALYVVGDGGLTHVKESTKTFTDLNTNFADTQFHQIAVHPTDGLRSIGGTLHNASPMQRGAAAGSTTPWFNGFGRDGAGAGFNVANPAIHYVGSNNGAFYRYDTAADTSATSIGPGGGPLVTPLILGGATRSVPVAITGGNVRKYVSGSTWSTHATGGSNLRALATSKFSGDRLYTGAQNGDLFRSNNFAGTFNKFDTAPLPDREVGGIVESFTTADHVIVGFKGTGPGGGVWRQANAGTPGSWVNRSGTGQTALPEVSVNDVERDPTNSSTYFAATDVGLFVSPDEGANWFNMGSMGFPNVQVNDLWVYSNGGATFLYAGTFGRGIWRCLLSSRNLTSLLVAKPEIWGGQQNTLTAKLNGSAPAGSLVKITDSSANVSVPSSVLIPQGSTQASFTIFSTNPTATQTVTVTATCWGSSVSNTFVLHAIPAFTYTPESANIYGGNRFNATIEMGVANPIVAVYTFSDNAAAVASPSAASIAAGSQSKTVPLYTAGVTSTVNALITARLANTLVTSPVSLHPRPDLVSLALNPTSVVGGTIVTGTITMTAAGFAGPQTVTTSDTSSVVVTPPSVVVPGGAATANFMITTSTVGSSLNVTIKARLRGITKTAVLNVHP